MTGHAGADQAGLYYPGHSLLHRCPAGPKLAVLLLGTIVLAIWRGLPALGAAALLVTVAYLAARIPPRTAWAQIRPLRWLIVALGAFQLAISGWRLAVAVVGTVVVLVAAAGLVTLTTRVSSLLDTFSRLLKPLRRLGFDPDRLALLAALTIRTVPVIAGLRDETAEARRARGLERSPRALLVPLVIRTIQHADRLGEALVARGLDD